MQSVHISTQAGWTGRPSCTGCMQLHTWPDSRSTTAARQGGLGAPLVLTVRSFTYGSMFAPQQQPSRVDGVSILSWLFAASYLALYSSHISSQAGWSGCPSCHGCMQLHIWLDSRYTAATQRGWGIPSVLAVYSCLPGFTFVPQQQPRRVDWLSPSLPMSSLPALWR